MSRDKQTEDLAKKIRGIKEYVTDRDGITYGERYVTVSHSERIAKHLLDAGYRKASDVALETIDSFQRILRHIFLNMCDGNDYERLNLLQIDGAIETLYDSFIAELKKKYESEGEG